eukprot:4053530-Alexandrium_andersonii.AAC.1
MVCCTRRWPEQRGGAPETPSPIRTPGGEAAVTAGPRRCRGRPTRRQRTRSPSGRSWHPLVSRLRM